MEKSLNLTSTTTQIPNAAQIVCSDIAHYHFSYYIFPRCNGKCDPLEWYYFSAYKYALEHETDLMNIL